MSSEVGNDGTGVQAISQNATVTESLGQADGKEYVGRPGYEGYLNFRVASAAEVLQDSGYFTAMSGKW